MPRPPGLAVTLHTCDGNLRSSWATEGGYELVAESMFQSDIDGFFMEYDSDRSGSYEPLRFLLTTKVGQIESEDEILRRIYAVGRLLKPRFCARCSG